MQSVYIHDIYSKLKNKEDIINFFREHGKQAKLINNKRTLLS